ncbi:MAG: hypothetical protein NTW50_05075 [Candidatus Berkelbacteria bacterium]|nr:hypothetical protein [Candidatus Berkelbacteria bacterium]
MKAKWVLAGVFIGLALGVWAGININVRVLDKNQQKELAEYQAIDNDVLKAIHDPASNP